MTPQEFNDLKWLINQKQWKTYLSFVDDQINNKLKVLMSCQNKDEAWDMKNRIIGIKESQFSVEQAIIDFENESAERGGIKK